jgi:hypothetical protein
MNFSVSDMPYLSDFQDLSLTRLLGSLVQIHDLVFTG